MESQRRGAGFQLELRVSSLLFLTICQKIAPRKFLWSHSGSRPATLNPTTPVRRPA